MSAETDLGWIFETHQAVYGGLLNLSVKCSACDGWTKGTIWDHRADLARQFFIAERDRAVREALGPVRALAEDWQRHRDTLIEVEKDMLDQFRAALSDEAGEGT